MVDRDNFGFLKYSGVVCEDGETIYMFGMLNCVETMKWQSEEDINYDNSKGDNGT